MSDFLLHLMRHGEPDPAGRLLGRTDSPVTQAGIRACAERARDLGTIRLVSSDLQRARRCADAIGRPAIDPRWRELDFGAWDGLCPSQVDAQTLGRFWEDPDRNPPPGGETWSNLVARIRSALDELPPEPVLAVTHGGPMRAALHVLCGLSLAQSWTFDLPYAALLSLRVSDGIPRRAMITGLLA